MPLLAYTNAKTWRVNQKQMKKNMDTRSTTKWAEGKLETSTELWKQLDVH
jgi:hypothetical protein